MKLKAKVISFTAAVCLLVGFQCTGVFADDVYKVDVSLKNEPTVSSAATVVPSPTPAPKLIYPISITTAESDGYPVIRKTYALNPNDDPSIIPKAEFTQLGETYKLTDIIQKESSQDQTMDHTETININTATKNLDDVIKQLTPDMKYDKDGYTGVLKLDMSSIQCEAAGYKTSSYTSTRTREYSNLSSPDTSLVPKSISDDGATYRFASVKWKSNSSSSIDYNQVADSYTAVVTYTTTGSSTKVTGYVTTADYTGKITKTVSGKTLYTAIFIGTTSLVPTPEPTPTSVATTQAPLPTTEAPQASASAPPKVNNGTAKIPTVAIECAGILLLLALLGAGGYFAYKKFLSANITVYNRKGREFIKLGKMKMDCKVERPTINLDLLSKKATSEVYIIEIDTRSVKQIIDKNIEVCLEDICITHQMGGEELSYGSSYQFEADFTHLEPELIKEDD